MSAFDSELLTPEDLWRRLRDIEDALLQIESGRGAPVLFGKPVGLGEPQDGDLVRFNAAENGWLPWSPKYMTARLSSDQTSNIAANDHVEFDAVIVDSGHIALSTGVDQANGIFSLPEGVYRLTAVVRCVFAGASASVSLRWAINGGGFLGPGSLLALPVSATNNVNSVPFISTHLIVGSAGADVELRIGTPVDLASVEAFFTYAVIEALA